MSIQSRCLCAVFVQSTLSRYLQQVWPKLLGAAVGARNLQVLAVLEERVSTQGVELPPELAATMRTMLLEGGSDGENIRDKD